MAGLTDSPAGLAARIVDLFRAFSATAAATTRHVFSRDQILTNLTIYWVTASIGPVMRGDCDFDHFAAPPPPGSGVQVPSGFAVFADSTARAVHPSAPTPNPQSFEVA